VSRLLPCVLSLSMVCLLVPVSAQRLPSRLKDPVAPPKAAPARPATNAPAPRAAAKPPAGPDKAVPFSPGETLTYDVSWSDFVTAGTATVTVRERRPSFGSTAWYIVAEGRPAPLLSKLYTLYYKADTLLDTRTLLPQRGSIFSQEGRRQRMKETQFDHAARRAVFQMKTRTTLQEEQHLNGQPTHDPLSAIYALRAMALAPGATTSFSVADSGELYTVSARVAGRETVQTGAGTVQAWRIVPTVRDQHGQPFGEGLALWVSDDARRVPVKLQARLPVGAFVLTLAGS
jgi:hypothetical protein